MHETHGMWSLLEKTNICGEKKARTYKNFQLCFWIILELKTIERRSFDLRHPGMSLDSNFKKFKSGSQTSWYRKLKVGGCAPKRTQQASLRDFCAQRKIKSHPGMSLNSNFKVLERLPDFLIPKIKSRRLCSEISPPQKKGGGLCGKPTHAHYVSPRFWGRFNECAKTLLW